MNQQFPFIPTIINLLRQIKPELATKLEEERRAMEHEILRLRAEVESVRQRLDAQVRAHELSIRSLTRGGGS